MALIRVADAEELPAAVGVVNAAFEAAYTHVRSSDAPPRTTLDKVQTSHRAHSGLTLHGANQLTVRTAQSTS